MNKTYSWSISSMTVTPNYDGLSNVVILINWSKTLSAETNGNVYVANINGEYSCSPADPNNFISYDNLTFNQVIGWVQSGYSEEELNAYLDRQVNNQINPPTINLPLPW